MHESETLKLSMMMGVVFDDTFIKWGGVCHKKWDDRAENLNLYEIDVIVINQDNIYVLANLIFGSLAL